MKFAKASKRFLYRGSDDNYKTYSLNTSRNNRWAKDSDPEAQKIVDKYLSLCVFKALRSNSIFTTSKHEHAIDYGDIYTIFPLNGFDFTWSKKYEDWVINDISELQDFDELEKLLGTISKRINDKLYANWNDAYQIKRAKNIIQSIAHDWWLDGINCIPKIRKDFTTYLSIIKKMPKLDVITLAEKKKILKMITTDSKNDILNAKKFCEINKMDNKNLSSALKSGNEIYIHGSYIAIKEYSDDFDDYTTLLQKYFFRAK